MIVLSEVQIMKNVCKKPRIKQIWNIKVAAFKISNPDSLEFKFYKSTNISSNEIFSSIFLVLLFVFGVHKRVVAPSILVQRLRYVLTDFGLSITESGSLVIKDSRNLLNKDR